MVSTTTTETRTTSGAERTGRVGAILATRATLQKTSLGPLPLVASFRRNSMNNAKCSEHLPWAAEGGCVGDCFKTRAQFYMCL